MPYKIKDHGFWEQYTPDEIPRGYPSGAMFARRRTDKCDWYAYAYAASTFKPTTVVATAMPDGDRLRVQAVVPSRDASMLFPAGARVIEITGADVDDPDPRATFGQHFVDIDAGTFMKDEAA